MKILQFKIFIFYNSYSSVSKLKVCLEVILENDYSIYNTFNDKKFQMLERLKAFPAKQTLNLSL